MKDAPIQNETSMNDLRIPGKATNWHKETIYEESEGTEEARSVPGDAPAVDPAGAGAGRGRGLVG